MKIPKFRHTIARVSNTKQNQAIDQKDLGKYGVWLNDDLSEKNPYIQEAEEELVTTKSVLDDVQLENLETAFDTDPIPQDEHVSLKTSDEYADIPTEEFMQSSNISSSEELLSDVVPDLSELSTSTTEIKKELESLREEVERLTLAVASMSVHTKHVTIADTQQGPGGFFEYDSNDEKIALTNNELDNIFKTSDIIESENLLSSDDEVANIVSPSDNQEPSLSAEQTDQLGSSGEFFDYSSGNNEPIVMNNLEELVPENISEDVPQDVISDSIATELQNEPNESKTDDDSTVLSDIIEEETPIESTFQEENLENPSTFSDDSSTESFQEGDWLEHPEPLENMETIPAFDDMHEVDPDALNVESFQETEVSTIDEPFSENSTMLSQAINATNSLPKTSEDPIDLDELNYELSDPVPDAVSNTISEETKDSLNDILALITDLNRDYPEIFSNVISGSKKKAIEHISSLLND